MKKRTNGTMRKMMSVILAVLMVAGLMGCAAPAAQQNAQEDTAVETSEPAEGPAAEETPAEPEETSGQTKIFFTNAILTAPYCALQLDAMQQYAAANNIDLQVADGKEDAQTQLDQIKNAVTQGVDGIIYFPGDEASTIPVVRYLDESGVPFIVLNSKVDESVRDLVPSYVGSDYEEMGKMAGELALDALGDEGGNVVIINGLSGTEVANSTTKGFMDVISTNGNIEILADQPADWDTAKAMTIMEDYITTFGDKIDLVFAVDSGMTKGAAQALENAGLWGEIPVVCSDQGQFVLDAIANGEMKGTAKQDAVDEGNLAMETIMKLVNGEAVETWEIVPTEMLTIDNIDGLKGY